MIRMEMLKKFHSIGFAFIDPPAEWENDVGFTEREIWVNNNGYGYIACDEPNARWVLNRIPDAKWKNIIELTRQEKLTIHDLEDTSFMELPCCHDYEEQDPPLHKTLSGILSLPPMLGDVFYCVDTWNNPVFFASEEEFRSYLRRDECDCEWESLDDQELARWVERLFTGEYDFWD